MTTYKLHDKKLVFRWGTNQTDLRGSLDVTEAYINLGGTLSPNTEVKFSSTFPTSTYKQTALTTNMRDKYECAGSMTAELYEPGKQSDYISISDYFDLTMHDPVLGDHHNTYLQHKIGNKKVDHTTKYLKKEDRHIKLNKKLYVVAYLDDEKVYDDYVKANLLKPKPQAFVKLKKERRKGKGFSRSELKDAGLNIKQALKLKIPVDNKRKSKHEENIERLRDLF